MATVIIPSTTFTATATLNLFLGTRVNINTEALGIAWVKNKQYRIELTEGFVKEVGKNISPNPGINNLTTITINSTDPTIQSTSPADNATNVTNNNNITITFNRGIKVGTGTIRLYKSDNTLIRTYTLPSAKVTFPTLSSVKIDVLGDLVASQGYYLLMDAGTILDKDGFSFGGISSSATLNYTTAASTNVDFPDLISSMSLTATLSAVTFIKEPIRITLSRNAVFALTCNAIAVTPNTAYLLDATGTYSYVEDTSNYLVYTPKISDYLYVNQGGTGSYTLTVTPGDILAVSSMSATNATFNNTNKVLTFTGTINQINNSLDYITFVPATDYDSNFTLSFAVTTPQNNTQTKTLNCQVGNPLDSDITNMNLTRTYSTNLQNNIFASNTPYISDFDTNINAQYTITLTPASGYFVDGSDTTLSASVSFTGTRSYINGKFNTISYYPLKNFSNNTTFNFTLTKNSKTLSNLTVSLNRSGNIANNLSTNIYTYSTVGNNIFSPTISQRLYGLFDILLVGGGGGGAQGWNGSGNENAPGGGGGAGELIYLTDQTISDATLSLTIGGGGSAGYIGNLNNGFKGANGFDGSASIFNNLTAKKGEGGIARNSLNNGSGNLIGSNLPLGGNSGNGYSGGDGIFVSNGGGYGGGGGAGSSGNGGNALGSFGPFYSTTGGVGGNGTSVSITGTNITYSKGGPGGGTQPGGSANATPGSGGRGSYPGNLPGSGLNGILIIKVHS